MHTKEETKELHIAPMLDVSTMEFHAFFRILSTKCILWTQMVVDETLYHTEDVDWHLECQNQNKNDVKSNNSNKRPIVCQLGGRNPDYCAWGAKLIEAYGYDEVNLNIDCPSSRVSGKRQFGAILMKYPQTAISVINAIRHNVESVPVSVKTRVGIDDFDSFSHLVQFIKRLRNDAGCKRFYLHARKCILGGLLTPAQNRIVPPLNYPRVYALCDHFPDCEFVLNGGIPGLKAAKILCHGTSYFNHYDLVENYDTERNFLCKITTSGNGCRDSSFFSSPKKHVVPCTICNVSNGSCTAPPMIAPPNLKGCMLGRAAMDNPSMFWDVDRYFYGMESNPCKNRREVLLKYCEYLEKIYPRRCCDDDKTMTIRIPAPIVKMKSAVQGCKICRYYYRCTLDETRTTTATMEEQQEGSGSNDITTIPKVKISSKVIDRALKPVLGIFFGQPKSKTFRRICDKLSRDLKVRNCGPGYILRKAIDSIPAELLDADFVKTEDLEKDDVPIHIAPNLNL